MTWDQIAGIVWPEGEPTAVWAATLSALLELAKSADTGEKRNLLADALDSFADNSSADDLTTIAKLDLAARKCARGLRVIVISDAIEALKASSAVYQTAVKELDAAMAGLKKEAKLLRTERFSAAVVSLTETINALKNLGGAVKAQDGEKLKDGITSAITSAQKLRSILEAPV
jgi:hypothetical protein